jgi:hypothetical protein
MELTMLSQIKKALQNLNPEEVRSLAARRPSIGIVAPTAERLWRIEEYLCPPALSPAKRAEVSRMIHRITAAERPDACDIEIWDDSLAAPSHVFSFDPDRPERTVEAVLQRRPDLALPLARFIQPFRKPAINHFISSVARENAFFSLATALPDLVPSFLSLPWAVGEFASDTAFLTGNQIRMTFLIAAASDHEVGYREQKAQIGSIVASAFGFRALARELVGKIPFGGGLLPKAAVSYAGTYVLGRSMERFYSIGCSFTRQERHRLFEQTLGRGREVAGSLLQTLRPNRANGLT